MRVCSVGVRVAVLAVAAALLGAGCSGAGDGDKRPGGGLASAGDHIKQREPSQLRDGGQLRLAVADIPGNLNLLHREGQTLAGLRIAQATLPRPFVYDTAGEPSVDLNYYTDIALTGTDPQQITYTINPEAVWSDGSPITWEDMRAQAATLKGENLYPSSRTLRVERGVDDRQAVVTIDPPIRMWREFFNPLLPKALTETPAAFNSGARDQLSPSAGPFVVTEVDRELGHVVLGRNPRWWGPTARLDTITLLKLDGPAWLPALKSNELDAIHIDDSIVDLAAAGTVEGFDVRRAPGQTVSRLVLNAGPDPTDPSAALLTDRQLRIAIVKAIDRDGVVSAARRGGAIEPQPMRNHVFLPGAKGYHDNSVAYDPAAAGRMLDDLGWRRHGEVREKNGHQLTLRYSNVTIEPRPATSAERQVARAIRQDLAAVGVELIVPPSFPSGGPAPLPPDVATAPADGAALPPVAPMRGADRPAPRPPDILFHTTPSPDREPYVAYCFSNPPGGRTGTILPDAAERIEPIDSELDPSTAAELLNEYDQTLWADGCSIPLYRHSDNHIVRSDLANWGPFGLATPDYAKIGYLN